MSPTRCTPQPKGLPGAGWVRRQRPNAQRLAHPPPWCSRMVRWELRSRDRPARPTKRVVDGSAWVVLAAGGTQTGGAQAWSNTSMTRNGNQVSVLDPVHAHPVDTGNADWRFCWSGSVWACQDLNLGPHPHQLNAGNRCADRPFRRSRSTVGAKVMRSTGALVCVLLSVPTPQQAEVAGGDQAEVSADLHALSVSSLRLLCAVKRL
jgi:hypothetical protein